MNEPHVVTQEEAEKLGMSLETFEQCLESLAEEGLVTIVTDESGRKMYFARKAS